MSPGTVQVFAVVTFSSIVEEIIFRGLLSTFPSGSSYDKRVNTAQDKEQECKKDDVTLIAERIAFRFRRTWFLFKGLNFGAMHIGNWMRPEPLYSLQ